MTLNYLFKNFLEQSEFATRGTIANADLQELIDQQIVPAASYRYSANGQTKSFVSDSFDNEVYQFHLKGHLEWLRAVQMLRINNRNATQNYFFDRYNSAIRCFTNSALGTELNNVMPEVMNEFNDELRQSTWHHFINGVYGVCTKDGMPETIFVKQVYVKFIDAFLSLERSTLIQDHAILLEQTVNALDEVLSEFAPHERATSSRQRCVADVQKILGA